MKIFKRVLSAILFLCAVVSFILMFVFKDHDLNLYKDVAHAYAYIGVILLLIYISVWLLGGTDEKE